MYRNYFDWKGNRYYTGSVFKVFNGKEEIFVGYNLNNDTCSFTAKGCNHMWNVPDNKLTLRLLEYTGKKDYSIKCPVEMQKSDMEIDGMFTGWVWYIVLMATSMIFKEFIYLWALITWLFFSWRTDKIEREGKYYEWKV